MIVFFYQISQVKRTEMPVLFEIKGQIMTYLT